MFFPTTSHKLRPIFRSSSTFYYLPSTDLVLHTAARAHENYRNNYLYREGRSTVIRWANLPDIFPKPETATDTTQGNCAGSSTSTGITSTSNSSNQASSSSSSYSDRDWHMKTVDLRYDSPDEEESDTDTEEEEYDEDSAFSSFMLHFPDEDEYDETEFEYDTVVYYDAADLSVVHAPNGGNSAISRSRTPRRAFAAGIPSSLGGYLHQSKKDRQITVLLNSVKKMMSMLFKAVEVPGYCEAQEDVIDGALSGTVVSRGEEDETGTQTPGFARMPLLQRAITI